MQASGLMSSGTPLIKKYKVNATIDVGEIAVTGTNATTGHQVATTTDTTEMVGLVVDQGLSLAAGGPISYSTTQGADEAVYGIIVNPDLILRLLMSGDASDGTALTEHDITTASTTGLTLTTGDDHSCPSMDGGVAWFTSGANVGESRKITSVSTTAATVIVPFPRDTVVGDTFIDAPYIPGEATNAVQLVTSLTQADASIATGTGAAMTPIETELNGTTDSYVSAINRDHVFGNST